MSPQEKWTAFAERAVAMLPGRIQCIVLTGSYARGEPRERSDIDLWVILDAVDLPALRAIGAVNASLPDGPEINVQCLTAAEAANPALNDSFSTVQLHCDGQVLFGHLPLPPPTTEQLRFEVARLAALVMLSARHYITGRESEEQLARKIEPYVLKPLMWALRYEAMARTGRYPRTLADLEATVSTPAAAEAIATCRQIRAGAFAGPYMPLVERVEDLCRDLVASASH